MVLAGLDSGTSTRLGEMIIAVTDSKSLCGSYGSFEYRVSLIACEPMLETNTV